MTQTNKPPKFRLVRGLKWSGDRDHLGECLTGTYMLVSDYDGWRWLLVQGRDLKDVSKEVVATIDIARELAQKDYEKCVLDTLNGEVIEDLNMALVNLMWAQGCVPFPSDCHSAIVANLERLGGIPILA